MTKLASGIEEFFSQCGPVQAAAVRVDEKGRKFAFAAASAVSAAHSSTLLVQSHSPSRSLDFRERVRLLEMQVGWAR